MRQRTFVMLKPDCYEKKLIGSVIRRLEMESGISITAMKMMKLDRKKCKEHYAHHKDKPFCNDLINFMTSGPVVAMVVEGEGVIERIRKLAGPTDSKKAPKGTIRGDFGEDIRKNIIHASDSEETAEKEIKAFFSESEIVGARNDTS